MPKAGVILLLAAAVCFALPFIVKGLGYDGASRALWAFPYLAIPLTAGAGALIGAWLWRDRAPQRRAALAAVWLVMFMPFALVTAKLIHSWPVFLVVLLLALLLSLLIWSYRRKIWPGA